jgi:hypothetical protein
MGDDLDLDLAGAQLRADGADMPAFVNALAVRLEGAVGDLVSVERKRAGMFSSRKDVRSVSCTVAEQTYTLTLDGARAVAQRGKTVRGITLKTETLPIAQWTAELVDALANHADASSADYQALRALLG